MQPSFALSPGLAPGNLRARLLALGRARGWVHPSCSSAPEQHDDVDANAHARAQLPSAARAALAAGILPEVKSLSRKSHLETRQSPRPRRSPRGHQICHNFGPGTPKRPTFTFAGTAPAGNDDKEDTDDELDRLSWTLNSAIQFRERRYVVTPPSPPELPLVLDFSTDSNADLTSDWDSDCDAETSDGEWRDDSEDRIRTRNRNRVLSTPAWTDVESSCASIRTTTVLKGQELWLEDLNGSMPTRRSSLNRAMFANQREGAARRLLDYFDAQVLDGALSGLVNVRWNKRLLKTAGLTYMRQCAAATDCSHAAAGAADIVLRTAVIELSTKVVDEPFRLYQTLAHEACHAAAWIVDGVARPPHGPGFQAWAKRFHRWDRELSISRCHNYAIRFRYTYACTQCAYEYGRHSKSIDTNKQVCGKCKSTLKLRPRDKRGGPKSARS
jgi:predicted SprT family Zn-dependent metalloprotease